MKTLVLKILSFTTLLIVAASSQAFASSGIGVATAYNKGGSKYDVVVKADPNTPLVMYVNDKTPHKTTTNKSHWATFRGVKLANGDKLSFTKVVTATHKTYQKPINYVRYAKLSANKISFVAPTPKPKVSTPPTAPAPTPAPAPQPASPAPTTPTANTGTNNTNLSNNNSYTNSAGATVHSPAASTDGQVPAGATARCVDGTYSFSQSRRGTCSHHGGVST